MNPDALQKGIEMLKDNILRIGELEKSEKPADVKLLRAFEKFARACAIRKGHALTGSEKTSEIVRLLVNPIQAAKLAPQNLVAGFFVKREGIAKSNANRGHELPSSAELTSLLTALRARGINVQAKTTAELKSRLQAALQLFSASSSTRDGCGRNGKR